jgi:hypothetical protein
MKRLLPIVVLVLSASTAFGEDPDLVEGARRAIAYWHSQYLQCGNNQGQGGAWYAVTSSVPAPGSIQMVPELRIQFKTMELSQEQRLNGIEFMATTSLEPGPFRWWFAPNKAWQDWQVGDIAPPRTIIKKKGVWSQDSSNRKPLAACSEIPPMDDKR